MTVDHSGVPTVGLTSEDVKESPTVSDAEAKPAAASSRRGKQYKCGNCQELGHNQKTCPRRRTLSPIRDEGRRNEEAASVESREVRRSLSPRAMTGSRSGGNEQKRGLQSDGMCGCGSGRRPGARLRLRPAKLELAIEAAHKRVLAADKQVANAATDEEYDKASLALRMAVGRLENFGELAKRCAAFVRDVLPTIMMEHVDDGDGDGDGEDEDEVNKEVEQEEMQTRTEASSCSAAPAVLSGRPGRDGSGERDGKRARLCGGREMMYHKQQARRGSGVSKTTEVERERGA